MEILKEEAGTDDAVRRAAEKAGINMDGAPDAKEAPKAPPKKVRPKPKKKPTAEELFPLAQWELIVGMCLDMISDSMGIQPRSNEQKKALAATSLAVLQKRVDLGDYAEEAALAVVAISIGVPMVIERNQMTSWLEPQPEPEPEPQPTNGAS